MIDTFAYNTNGKRNEKKKKKKKKKKKEVEEEECLIPRMINTITLPSPVLASDILNLEENGYYIIHNIYKKYPTIIQDVGYIKYKYDDVPHP